MIAELRWEQACLGVPQSGHGVALLVRERMSWPDLWGQMGKGAAADAPLVPGVRVGTLTIE